MGMIVVSERNVSDEGWLGYVPDFDSKCIESAISIDDSRMGIVYRRSMGRTRPRLGPLVVCPKLNVSEMHPHGALTRISNVANRPNSSSGIAAIY